MYVRTCSTSPSFVSSYHTRQRSCIGLGMVSLSVPLFLLSWDRRSSGDDVTRRVSYRETCAGFLIPVFFSFSVLFPSCQCFVFMALFNIDHERSMSCFTRERTWTAFHLRPGPFRREHRASIVEYIFRNAGLGQKTIGHGEANPRINYLLGTGAVKGRKRGPSQYIAGKKPYDLLRNAVAWKDESYHAGGVDFRKNNATVVPPFDWRRVTTTVEVLRPPNWIQSRSKKAGATAGWPQMSR